jgi:hypothetical protein
MVQTDMEQEVEFISNTRGDVTGVIVPIELWNELAAELETRHLLQNKAMRERLLQARERTEGIALDEAMDRLGILRDEIE